ncbi:hypothetical protein CVD28_02385 [Bacillus sp. M6-12]|uniref:hypothetical protein n=1 Tax=Bacillus sp. M6-12 TaxID=2054166 RepID=UPI000C76343D|nr:hypothetical protein [Bacillus sp. M6-12]PLS19280.1 hypothetical protein CVD28_02385 [Bacillus sp. M6-12]
MSQSIVMPIEELLCLEEGKKVSLLEVYLNNKSPKTVAQFSLGVEMDADYVMFLSPFIENIMECLKESMYVVDIEKLLSQEGEKIPFAMIQLFADENGFNVGSRFYQIEEEDLKKKGLHFYAKLNTLLEELIEYVNQLVEEYAIMKDNEKIYSPREFQFLYQKVNGQWEYDTFVRMTDRMISEQKGEIHGLLTREIDKKLLAITNANEHIETRRLAIKFYSDGLSINAVEMAGY